MKLLALCQEKGEEKGRQQCTSSYFQAGYVLISLSETCTSWEDSLPIALYSLSPP